MAAMLYITLIDVSQEKSSSHQIVLADDTVTIIESGRKLVLDGMVFVVQLARNQLRTNPHLARLIINRLETYPVGICESAKSTAAHN